MTTDLRELLAQAMRDANTSEAWQASGGLLVPFAAYADAILALVDVDVEYGLTWPPTGDIDWCDNEMEARALATQPQPPELASLRDLGRLRRRWVLTTKPEPVTDPTA